MQNVECYIESSVRMGILSYVHQQRETGDAKVWQWCGQEPDIGLEVSAYKDIPRKTYSID